MVSHESSERISPICLRALLTKTMMLNAPHRQGNIVTKTTSGYISSGIIVEVAVNVIAMAIATPNTIAVIENDTLSCLKDS